MQVRMDGRKSEAGECRGSKRSFVSRQGVMSAFSSLELASSVVSEPLRSPKKTNDWMRNTLGNTHITVFPIGMKLLKGNNIGISILGQKWNYNSCLKTSDSCQPLEQGSIRCGILVFYQHVLWTSPHVSNLGHRTQIMGAVGPQDVKNRT